MKAPPAGLELSSKVDWRTASLSLVYSEEARASLAIFAQKKWRRGWDSPALSESKLQKAGSHLLQIKHLKKMGEPADLLKRRGRDSNSR